jgi:hypothetical protein
VRQFAGLLIGALIGQPLAACGDATAPTWTRPLFAQASTPAVTATCGTLGQITRVDDTTFTVPYTAPAQGPCRVIATATTADTSVVNVASADVTAGVPFGPFAFWSGGSVVWGPQPMTSSIGQNSVAGVVTQITAARAYGMHLVLCLAGCAHDPVKTNGKFDLTKWKAAIALYNTATIRNAIAQAVSDGTVIGNELIDEPEIADWGGVLTKPMLDGMASYVTTIFPTLPQGVGTGGTASYTWRTTERYAVVDFVIAQFAQRNGDAATYRSNVLARAALEGWTPAFSLNLLNGGTPGTTCSAGVGTNAGLCRMTAAQVTSYGKALGPSGCVMVMWKYEDAFFARSDNQQAFRDVAGALSLSPRRRCVRP